MSSHKAVMLLAHKLKNVPLKHPPLKPFHVLITLQSNGNINVVNEKNSSSNFHCRSSLEARNELTEEESEFLFLRTPALHRIPLFTRTSQLRIFPNLRFVRLGFPYFFSFSHLLFHSSRSPSETHTQHTDTPSHSKYT